MEEQKQTLLEKIKKLIPEDPVMFDSTEEYDTFMEYTLDCSVSILMNTIYPFEDWSDYDIPKSKFNWLMRCCVELYNLADKSGYKSYAENGLSWSKDTDGLSKSLMRELIPHVGTPSSVYVEEAKKLAMRDWENLVASLRKEVSETVTNLRDEVNTTTTTLRNDVETTTTNLKSNVDTRVTSLENSVNTKVSDLDTSVDNRVSTLESSVNDKVDKLDKSVDTRVSDLETSVNTTTTNLENKVNTTVSTLRKDVNETTSNLEIKLQDMASTAAQEQIASNFEGVKVVTVKDSGA